MIKTWAMSVSASLLVLFSTIELTRADSFVATCEKNNELEVRYSGSNCDLDWNKGGESTRCKIKNSVMKFSSYDSAGQATLDLKSGVLKGMGGVYKCNISGDIGEVASVSSTKLTTTKKGNSFVATCEKNNELKVRYSGSNCDLDWNKGGESNKCRISDSVMKFQTYDSAGTVELNLASGLLTHGVNNYKCNISGDIGEVASVSSTKLTTTKKGNSFVATCEKNNELEVSYSGSNCDLDWNKLGESNKCRISDSVMKFQTYDSAGTVELNLASGLLTHGVNNYKCKISGDIEFVENKEKGTKEYDATTVASTSDADPAIELEYWQTVKDSDAPDLLQAYLDEYPNGKFAPLARLKIKKLSSD